MKEAVRSEVADSHLQAGNGSRGAITEEYKGHNPVPSRIPWGGCQTWYLHSLLSVTLIEVWFSTATISMQNKPASLVAACCLNWPLQVEDVLTCRTGNRSHGMGLQEQGPVHKMSRGGDHQSLKQCLHPKIGFRLEGEMGKSV